jgi:hypothetical protein
VVRWNTVVLVLGIRVSEARGDGVVPRFQIVCAAVGLAAVAVPATASAGRGRGKGSAHQYPRSFRDPAFCKRAFLAVAYASGGLLDSKHPREQRFRLLRHCVWCVE